MAFSHYIKAIIFCYVVVAGFAEYSDPLFADDRNTKAEQFLLTASELENWLKNDPEAQRILALPENSPEKELFESLLALTFTTLRQDNSKIGFSGMGSRQLLASLFYGPVNLVLQTGPSEMFSHPYPEYLGLVMHLQMMAIDTLQGPIPDPEFNRFIGGIQFMIQAMAAGIHTPDEIRAFAAKTEVRITGQVGKRQITNAMKATELLRVLEKFGVPLSLDGATLAPHWRYWNVHDYSVLELPPVTRITLEGPSVKVPSRRVQSLFDVLIEQTKPKNRPELATQFFDQWVEKLKTQIDWRSHFPEQFTKITGADKEAMIRTILLTVEPHPTKYNAAVLSALTKEPAFQALQFDRRKVRKLWRDIFEISLPIVHELRKEKLRLDAELKAQEEAQAQAKLRKKAEEESQRAAEARRAQLKTATDAVYQRVIEILHTQDAELSLLSLHSAFMADIYRNSMIEGRSPIPETTALKFPEDSKQSPNQILELMAAAIQVEQDHDPVLKAHLEYLESKAKAYLQRTLTEREIKMIRELQIVIFIKRIETQTETTTKIPLRPEQIQDLESLGLYGALNTSPAQLETERLNDPFRLYRTPSLHVRDTESDAKVLKRNAARAKGFNAEDPAQLAYYLFKRMGVFEAEFINFIDDPNLDPMTESELSQAELEDFEVKYAQYELYRTLKVIVSKNPTTPAELRGYLMDSKLMKGLTKDGDRIVLPEWMATQIMNQAQFIMHAMTYPTSCREAILSFIPRTAEAAAR